MMAWRSSLTPLPSPPTCGCRPMVAAFSSTPSTTASRHGARSAGKLSLASFVRPALGDVDRRDRTAIAVPAVELEEAARQGLAGDDLQLRIERRADRQSAGIELVLAVELEHLAARLLGEGFGGEELRAGRPRVGGERLRLERLLVLGRDVAVLRHAGEHPVTPLDRFIVLLDRMIVVGAFRQCREIGHLVEGELVQRFAEVVQRRRGDAVRVEAEEDLVEIELENLVLAEGLLDALGEQRLLQLALGRLFAGEQEVLGHLLRDGRGADEPAAVAAQAVLQVDERRPRDPLPVKPGVTVESLVLGRDERLDQLLGNGVHRNEEAPLARIFGKQRPVARMHAGHHRRVRSGQAAGSRAGPSGSAR